MKIIKVKDLPDEIHERIHQKLAYITSYLGMYTDTPKKEDVEEALMITQMLLGYIIDGYMIDPKQVRDHVVESLIKKVAQ